MAHPRGLPALLLVLALGGCSSTGPDDGAADFPTYCPWGARIVAER